jgi:hypothetical protein
MFEAICMGYIYNFQRCSENGVQTPFMRGKIVYSMPKEFQITGQKMVMAGRIVEGPEGVGPYVKTVDDSRFFFHQTLFDGEHRQTGHIVQIQF